MRINRNLMWTSTDIELPNNTRPVTAVIDSLDGPHIVGAYCKDKSWYEMYTKEQIKNTVLCWTDIEIPQQYLF